MTTITLVTVTADDVTAVSRSYPLRPLQTLTQVDGTKDEYTDLVDKWNQIRKEKTR
jgi:hypothetical protein